MTSHHRKRANTNTFLLVIGLILILVSAAVLPNPSHASSPELSIEIDIGETYLPLLTRARQAQAWPTIWQKTKLIAYYVPTVAIEGETQKTHRRLAFFSCMVGTACLPDPHIETSTRTITREVKAQAAEVSQNAAGHTHLRFTLPESPAEHYRFGGIMLQSSAGPLAAFPEFNPPNVLFANGKPVRPLRNSRQAIGVPLEPSLEPTDAHAPAFALAQADVPGLWPDVGANLYALVAIRGSVRDSQGQQRVLRWPGNLPDGLKTWQSAHPAALHDGKLPHEVIATQVPLNWSLNLNAPSKIVTIAMPEQAPRWHGLVHYNFPNGTRVIGAQSGPFTRITLHALAGKPRQIEDREPVKNESWLFLNGALLNYSGDIHYGNNAPAYPSTEWSMSWLEGTRTQSKAAFAPSDFLRATPACTWPGCEENLAEARAQLRKTDEALQAEGELYLRLLRDIQSAESPRRTH